MARQNPHPRRRRVTERHGFWFRLGVLVVWPLVQLLTRRQRAGLENIPATGGALLVANHVSIVDPLTTAQLVYDAGRLPHFLAKATLFTAPVAGRVMRGTRQIPVARGTTDAVGSLAAAQQALADGDVVIIYPEGTTTRDPEMWPMRAFTGVARLALAAGVPVIPVAQWGAHAIHRRGGRIHLFARPTIVATVGAPLDLSPWASQDVSPRVLREVTDLIMGSITSLLAEIRGEQVPEHPWDPRAAAAGGSPRSA